MRKLMIALLILTGCANEDVFYTVKSEARNFGVEFVIEGDTVRYDSISKLRWTRYAGNEKYPYIKAWGNDTGAISVSIIVDQRECSSAVDSSIYSIAETSCY